MKIDLQQIKRATRLVTQHATLFRQTSYIFKVPNRHHNLTLTSSIGNHSTSITLFPFLLTTVLMIKKIECSTWECSAKRLLTWTKKIITVSTLTLSLKLLVLKLASDSLCSPGGRAISALNFMKRMLEACVSSTIRVALGKHLLNNEKIAQHLVYPH